MRAVFLGNFRYPWCSEVHLSAALEANGVDVIRLQEPPPPGAATAGPLTTLVDVAAHGNNADLFLWMRTWGGLDDAGFVRALRSMEANGCVTATWSLDLYVGLTREAMIDPATPQWGTQWVFTADGDPATQALMDARGIRHVWMPPAVDAAEAAVDGAVDPGRWPHDVIFVGSDRRFIDSDQGGAWTYHAEWPWRTQLIRWLHSMYEHRFFRYGGDTAVVRGLDLNSLYATTPAVVGDSLCPPGTARYWSDRIVETLGRGGTLAFPNVPGLAETYGLVDGVHCRLYEYGDLATIKDFVDWAVADRDGGRTMAAAGRAAILNGHTYADRVADALKVLGLR